MKNIALFVKDFQKGTELSSHLADIDMDITDIFKKWISGSSGFSYPNGITNNGIVLKLTGSTESGSSTDRFNLKFFTT